MREVDRDNWPVVMRSSQYSNHMEWKRTQDKNISKERFKVKPQKEVISETDNNSLISKNLKRQIDSYTPVASSGDISYIRNRYSDSIIVWIGNIETIGDKTFCRYLLEYKKQYLDGRGKTSINMFEALYNCIYESFNRIHDYPKFDIIVIFPLIITTLKLENENLYNKIFSLIKVKAQKNYLYTMPDRQNDINAYIEKHSEKIENSNVMTYEDLVNKAKKQLNNPEHYGKSSIEFIECTTWQNGNQINLWTYWQGYQIKDPENGVDILLVGQDWGNPNRDTRTIELIERIQRGDEIAYHPDKSPTDMRLRDMFTYLGCDIDSKTPGKRLFFTNYCLGYRGGSETGDMTRQILDADKELFNDLVSVIKPHIIICLGKMIYEQVSGRIADRFTEILKEKGPFISPYPGDESIKVYGVPHCGVWGVRNIGGEEAMRKLWQQIAENSGLL
ncbi:MAG: hypothetical protein IJL20_12920 [Lachnospiraceae bacterium]|nr:hypothetical protein [Lachnospiraceae bacterium]